MLKVKQIYEDRDKRRAGRTFKIQNIDFEENKATVEILTGPGGTKPKKNNEISFINISRFRTNKYYKLKQDVVGTYSSETPKKKEERITVLQDTVREIKEIETIIVRRTNNKPLFKECQELWPGNWAESGPFATLDSKNFEIMIRRSNGFSKAYDIKAKFKNFCIYNEISDKPLGEALMDTRTALAQISEELIDMVLPDEVNYDQSN